MASLYGEDFTRAVEPGMEVETGRNLVRRCGNELGVATWEAYDFDPDTRTCETFSNREAAELWLSGSLYLDECNELDDQLTQSVKRMATLVANMSGGRWTAGIQEYRDGRKSLSFQLSDETGFFLITSPICKASELALGVVRDRVREELADLDPYREALEACRRAEDSSIALDKLAFYEKLKDRDMPVLLGALAVATEQNQRAIGRLLADRKFEDMPELPDAINPMEAAFAEAKGKLLEWKEGGHGDGMYYHDTASSYLDDYHDMADEIGRPLLEGIDEMIEYGYVDESGIYENPFAAIGTMLAEAALEHARADAEYFDEDFRMRATEGINLWTVAKEIIEAVPAAKPAEEEPAQARGPKH
ncbi:hypothetical protein [Eggerthella lenta]|nr:hypothetical protein [Eggerthella lenta]